MQNVSIEKNKTIVAVKIMIKDAHINSSNILCFD